MGSRDEGALAQAVAAVAHPLVGARDDFDPLIERIGDARIVLVGEATHGTHEFYRLRAQITKRLIMEKKFNAVAAEADWPDAYRVNRWVRGSSDDADTVEALSGFQRFPAWMWRNTDVVDFVGWLRFYNERHDAVGFYGLDLYSLHGSIGAVLDYLDEVDPDAARRARYRYACFEDFGDDPQAYAYATSFGLARDCEREVIAQLLELQRRQQEILMRDGIASEDEHFQAEQNARVVKNAEEYYRSMFRGRVASWNLRDTHMADTLEALLAHLDRRDRPAKIVVWAHNSHVGDARATEMGDAGELTLGQLVRERHRHDARLVGFTTYAGTLTAASEWGAPAERKRVRRALPGSYEDVFHRSGVAAFVMPLDHLDGAGGLRRARLERAIGVVYKPKSERISHYLHAQLPDQFDAVIHIDETRALEPLERSAGWERGELPETYPSGM